jgi:hypothetical protein
MRGSERVVTSWPLGVWRRMVVCGSVGCVYREFVSGEHVKVWVDWVVVEGDETVCPWRGSGSGKDGGGGGSEAVAECCKRSGAGGACPYCVVELEVWGPLDVM